MSIPNLFAFMQERHAIWERKVAGQPKPWTQDPILQSYRFCNVYRELDTVTVWINNNWRNPNFMDPDVWFAMAVARLTNWPDTMEEIGYPVPWDPSHFVKTLEDLRGSKVFTGAYMIPGGPAKMSKPFYLATGVLGPLWEKRDYIRPKAGEPLAAFHSRLTEFKGMGSFLAGQVVCDTKYTKALEKAPDWWTWACSGPGSKRGLNRVLGRLPNTPWTEKEWFRNFGLVKCVTDQLAFDAKMSPVHGQDLQNCLCEFDKYQRVKYGEGKPRSKYAGT
jgi:alpha-glutamyl/putrescinyl thymine pyrophosphorylase clade 1